MLRLVLLLVPLSVVSAAQNQRIPVTQTIEMLRSANDVFTRVARFGGGGLAIFLPVLLCIGFFAFIIPFVAILFLGAGSFSGGSPGWGGSAGLYPAGRNLAELIPGLPVTNEQLVQAMTFLDKAVTEFGSKLSTTSTATNTSAKKRTAAAKSLDKDPDFSSKSAPTVGPEPEDAIV